MMLASPAGVQALATWPQYSSSFKDTTAANKGHIHVSVFQYVCYWFAFYAIKGGDAGVGGIAHHNSISGGGGTGFSSSVRRAADALHLIRGKETDPALRNPYIAMLRQMLTELVPRPLGAAGASPLASPRLTSSTTTSMGGGAMVLPTSPYFRPGTTATGGGPSARGSDAASRGVVFYSTLLEFWLKDADEPVAVASTAAADARSGGRGQWGGGGGAAAQPAAATSALWATTYDPPSEDLLEALGELVRYVTVVAPRAPAHSTSAWLPLTPVLAIQTAGQGKTTTTAAAGAGVVGGKSSHAALLGPMRLGAAAQPGAQALSRQLYRFFHRALSMWPDQRSIKPILRVFLSFVAPWQASNTSATTDSHAPGALASHLTAQVSELVHRVGHRSESPRGGGGGDGISGSGGGISGAGGTSGSGSNGGALVNSAAAYSSEWDSHVLSNIPFYLELFPLFLERSISRVSVRGETAVQDVLRVLGVLESSSVLVSMLRSVERDFNRCAASQPRRAEGPYAELLPWLIDQAQDWQMAATANALGDSPASLRSVPSYTMFATAGDRCAALAAKDLLDLSASVLKPEQQRRLRKCLERVLPLAELAEVAPVAAASAAVAGIMDFAPRLPRSTWRDVQFKGDSLERPVMSFEIGPLVRLSVAASQRVNAALGLDHAWHADEEPPENRIQEILVALRRKGKRVNLRPVADVRNLFWFPVAWWTLQLLLRVGWIVLVAIVTGINSIEEQNK